MGSAARVTGGWIAKPSANATTSRIGAHSGIGALRGLLRFVAAAELTFRIQRDRSNRKQQLRCSGGLPRCTLPPEGFAWVGLRKHIGRLVLMAFTSFAEMIVFSCRHPRRGESVNTARPYPRLTPRASICRPPRADSASERQNLQSEIRNLKSPIQLAPRLRLGLALGGRVGIFRVRLFFRPGAEVGVLPHGFQLRLHVGRSVFPEQ